MAPFVAHAAIATGRFVPAAVALAAVQVAALTAAGLRAAHGPARVGLLSVAAVLLALLAARLASPSALGLLATSGVAHTAIHGGLLLAFAQSLLPGRVPLVTAVALRLRPALPPAERRYTRTVTAAWCGFFAADLLLSAGLLAWAPHPVWSLFVNVLDLPLVVAMFAGEYAVRCLRFRGQAHFSPLAVFRSFARG